MDIAVTIQQAQAFVLVLFRVSGIVFFAPILGSSAIPPIAKIGISLGAAVLFFPAVYDDSLVIPNNAFLLALAIAGELLLGMAIGLLGQVVSSAVQFGGRIIGFHMGMRIANVLDPQTEFTVSLIGAFYNIVTILLLLSLDFHIVIIKVIRESYRTIRPLGLNFRLGAAEVIIRAGADIFLFAVQVIAPVLSALFLVEVAMAVLAKTARQFNILMLQFPIKILLGSILIVVALRAMPEAVEYMYRGILDQIGVLFRMLG